MTLWQKLFPKFDLPARIKIDIHSCIGCGLCREVCPYALPQPTAMGTYEISNPSLCVECGACANNCPVQAIELIALQGCGCIWCDNTTQEAGGSCSDPADTSNTKTSSCCGEKSSKDSNSCC